MADEGQDWPQNEAELLKLLYGPARIVAADGIDQLLRGQRCNWFKGVDESGRALVRLRRCLRMKSNLASFANAIGREARIAWDTEPNPEAAGGRIIVLHGSYAAQSKLHAKLVGGARKAGNELIIFWFVSPLRMFSRGNRVAEAHSVWDLRRRAMTYGTRQTVTSGVTSRAALIPCALFITRRAVA